MLVLGIESTSHTASIGISEDGKILGIKSHTYRPQKGGINPREAADHHRSNFPSLLQGILDEHSIEMEEIDRIAFSIGPGLGPSLKVGASMARYLAMKYRKPLIPVNHGIAHLEVARVYSGLNEPLYLYVSGGNTQLIVHGSNRYVVIGETLDIGIGNFLDKLAREMGIPFPGAPILEKKAQNGRTIIDCPYIVKAMDVSFSGLYTSLKNKINSIPEEEIAYNAQEYAFSALAEVAERAMAHHGLSELTMTGGVAMNRRLRQILGTMTEERGWKFKVPPDMYLSDNGGMIALAGERIEASPDYNIAIRQYDRVDNWNLDFISREFKYSPEGIGGESFIKETEIFSLKSIQKVRIERKYRNPQLDKRIRSMRIRKEIRSYRYFHDLGIRSPNVLFVDEERGIIWLEKINGTKLTNILLSGGRPDLSALGRIIGKIHRNGIAHGDLTTSNVLYDGGFVLIDPSMAELNAGLEDLAVDIHLFKESLRSLRKDWENLFQDFIKGYGEIADYKEVLNRVMEIEGRRRYVV